jgi:hypothetical protein
MDMEIWVMRMGTCVDRLHRNEYLNSKKGREEFADEM